MRSLLILVPLVLLVGCVPTTTTVAPTTAAKPTAKLWDREELRAAVVGKTEAEVLKLLGKPESTNDHGIQNTTWFYREIAKDKIAGKVDDYILIYFEAGRVDRVAF